MKISKRKLKQIIAEELSKYVGSLRDEEERDRLERIFPAITDLRRISNGIYEKEKKGRRNCTRGNPYHSKSTGQFVDPKKESGSWSIDPEGDHDDGSCRAGQARRPSANKKSVFTKIRCGRGEGNKGKSKHKCGGGGLWESKAEIVFEDGAYLRGWVDEQVIDRLDAYEKSLKEDLLLDEDKAAQVKAYCSRMGLKSLREWLLIQNQMVSSAKGEMGKEG